MSKPAEKVEAPEKEKKTTINKNKKATKPVDTSKYEGAGQSFKAKLIGFEDVSEAKGEKLCQVAIAKLKAAVLALGEHKEKIVLNLTIDGISIFDEKKEVLLHRHELSIISYVARDIGDSRTFAYIINDENGKHRCVAIKTEKSADVPVACLKELFQALEEKRNKSEDGLEATEATNVDGEINVAEETNGTLENNATVDSSKNLLGLENDFFGLELAAPAPVQAQPNSDLTALLLDEVFGAPEVAPKPVITSPKDTINLLSSPPTSPVKPPVVPQYQQLLASQFSGMEGNLSPLQNPSFSPKAYPMSQPSPFKAVLQAQNGWTSFEALSAPLAAPTPAFPSDLISPFSAVPQQPQTPQKQTSVDQPSTPIDPFSDLSFLSNLQNQPAKKPVTRTDFVKDPPKITLMDLVGQKRDSFGLPMHSSQQHLSTATVSFDSVDESDRGSFAGDVPEDTLRQTFNSLPRQDSLPISLPEPSPQAPVPQMRMSHLDKLRSNGRPLSIDFSAQRFSVFEDRRGLNGPTEINWFNSASSEPSKPSPAPRARQRFMNNN